MQPAQSLETVEDRGQETGPGWGGAGTEPEKGGSPRTAGEGGDLIPNIRQACAKAGDGGGWLMTREEGHSPACPQTSHKVGARRAKAAASAEPVGGLSRSQIFLSKTCLSRASSGERRCHFLLSVFKTYVKYVCTPRHTPPPAFLTDLTTPL